MEIGILTYNIRHCRGTDGKVDLPRVLNVLKESSADIIALQEVDRSLPRSGFEHQAEHLAAGLGFKYGFHSNFGVLNAGMGNAIISRFPIHSTWNTRLPYFGEPRGLLHVVVDTGGGEINVLSTHWGLTPGQRADQSRATIKKLRQLVGPLIVCGDLNAVRNSLEVHNVVEKCSLADCGPDDKYTFPSNAPVVKIDFVLVSQDFTALSAEIIQSNGSDHNGVLARCRWNV